MNPVRSLAPALFAGGTAFSVLWIFVAAPFCGAILGALVYELLRGDAEHAKSVIDDLPINNTFFIQEAKQEQQQKCTKSS